MLMIYGTLMPLRMLEEIRLWKMRERENIVILLQLSTDLESQYVQLLTAWDGVLDKTCIAVQQWISSVIDTSLPAEHPLHSEKNAIIKHALNQSEDLIQHLARLSAQSVAISGSSHLKMTIQHMIRESEYFLGIFHTVIAGEKQTDISGNLIHSGMMTNSANSDISIKLGRSDLSDSSADGTWSEPISQRPVPIGGHTLPPLPYAYNALEPYIDEETMRLHHDKHHLAYVNGLNKAENMLEQARQNNDFALIKHWEREAAFNGGGHYLHTIFWNIMSPQGGGKAFGPIAAQINQSFASFDKFKAHFTHAAQEVEGSGWAILVWGPRSHRLEILQAEKHQNLSQWDVIPLLVLDVWEHAYYLKYKNVRANYIDAWWHTVNWHHVNDRFVKARHLKWTPY